MTSVEYSEAPACTIDLTALSKTRFLLPAERRFPYRDEQGRININLLDASKAELESDTGRDPHESETLRSRISAWQRASKKAIAARPDDEKMTLDELVDIFEKQKQPPTKAAATGTPTKASPAPAQPPLLPSRSIDGAATPARGSHPATITMRRRLFRKPKKGDEPTYDVDEEGFFSDLPLEADAMHLGRIADERKRSDCRRGGSRKAAKKEAAASPAQGNRLKVTTRGTEEAAAAEAAASSAGGAPARVASPAPSFDSSNSRSSREGSAREGSSDDSDVYDIERVLEEDESGEGRGFLIRWAGFGPEWDTWEPEANLAVELVATFRHERNLARSNRGEDYMLGRTKLLWCAPCGAHHPIDNFSANQRRCCAGQRVCLSHHYKVQAAPHVSLLTGAAHETPNRVKLEPTSTSERKGSHSKRASSTKRAREAADDDSSDGDHGSDEEEDSASASLLWAPAKPQRSVARALSHRQAALDVSSASRYALPPRTPTTPNSRRSPVGFGWAL